MPSISLPLGPAGPAIEIGISAPASLQQQGAPSPPVQWIPAIADTGCTGTAVYTDVAAAAYLPIVSQQNVSTAGGDVTVNVYFGDVHVRWQAGGLMYFWTFANRPLGQLLNVGPSNRALVGMDLLTLGVFIVNGPNFDASFTW